MGETDFTMETRVQARLSVHEEQIHKLQKSLEEEKWKEEEFRNYMMKFIQQHRKLSPKDEGSNSSRHSTEVRMELPIFSSKDPQEWLQRIETYFRFNRTPANQRFSVVQKSMDVSLSGKYWFELISEIFPCLTWLEFKKQFMERFGSSEILNEELAHKEEETGKVMNSDPGSKHEETNGDGMKTSIVDVNPDSSMVLSSDNHQDVLSDIVQVQQAENLIHQGKEKTKLLLLPEMSLYPGEGDIDQPAIYSHSKVLKVENIYLGHPALQEIGVKASCLPEVALYLSVYTDTGQEFQINKRFLCFQPKEDKIGSLNISDYPVIKHGTKHSLTLTEDGRDAVVVLIIETQEDGSALGSTRKKYDDTGQDLKLDGSSSFQSKPRGLISTVAVLVGDLGAMVTRDKNINFQYGGDGDLQDLVLYYLRHGTALKGCKFEQEVDQAGHMAFKDMGQISPKSTDFSKTSTKSHWFTKLSPRKESLLRFDALALDAWQATVPESEEWQQQHYYQLEENLILVALDECNKDGGIVCKVFRSKDDLEVSNSFPSFPWMTNCWRQPSGKLNLNRLCD